MRLLQKLASLRPGRRVSDAQRALRAELREVAADRKELQRQLRTMHRTIQQLQQSITAQQQTLATLPDLETRIGRCVAAYQKDASFAGRAAAFESRFDVSRALEHAAACVARARLESDPCPYIVLDGVLPDDMYRDVIDAVPPPVFFKKSAEGRAEMTVPFPFAPAFSRIAWGAFHQVIQRGVLPAVLDKFKPALDDVFRMTWPMLGPWSESGVQLGIEQSRLMLRTAGYTIEPHRDPRWAFLTAIFYLPTRDEATKFGTQFYRLKSERDAAHSSPLWVDAAECELVRDVPCAPNTAVIFLNSTGAHGASIPPDAPKDLERYIYQVQFGPDTATKQYLIELLSGAARDRWAVSRGKAYS